LNPYLHILQELKRNRKFWIGTLAFGLLESLTVILPLGNYTWKTQVIMMVVYVFCAPGPTRKNKMSSL